MGPSRWGSATIMARRSTGEPPTSSNHWHCRKKLFSIANNEKIGGGFKTTNPALDHPVDQVFAAQNCDQGRHNARQQKLFARRYSHVGCVTGVQLTISVLLAPHSCLVEND